MTKQLPLFDNFELQVPPTEGIKYAGSKRKLLPAILALVEKTSARTVLDGFSGTTRVSQALAKRGYTVLCNDIAVWSEVFGSCYLLAGGPSRAYSELIAHLNAVDPVDGWFTEHYGGDPNDGCSVQADGRKRPWQRHNTRKLDAIRQEIDCLQLSGTERAVALASLLLALDRVDNTLGHFVSYLNDWAPRSYNPLHLTVPAICTANGEHQVSRRDALEIVREVDADLAYFDPPYGSNNEKMPPSRVRYASYYHIWTTVCLNDRPELFGKAKRRKDSSDRVAASVFEDFRKDDNGRYLALRAIDTLLSQTNARWVILSYSSGGRATADELDTVLQRNGRLLEVVELAHKRNVMAGMRWTHEWLREAEAPNREFLFLLER